MAAFGPQDWHLLLENLPLSPASDCSYFPDRKSCVNYFFADEDISPELQELAINAGYRRCGDTWYRTNCPNCNLCISYRVATTSFKASSNQKQVLRRNRDIQWHVATPELTAEKEEIYVRYQYSQHHERPPFVRPGKDKEFDEAESLSVMHYQMYTNPASTRELEFHLEGRLVGFGIIDVAITTTSLVYFVFDPEYRRRSLGTLNILRSIQWATEQGFEYVNLGYYIPGHMKMDYKSRFKPAEYLDNQTLTWQSELPPLREPNKK